MAIIKTGRSRLLAVGATAALAAGLVGIAGIALAQEEPDNTTPTPYQHAGDRDCGIGHPGGLLNHVLEASGLELETFRQGAVDGKSINTVLEENGLDPATVQADALALLQEHLDQAVADGKLTEEQAGTIAARAAEALPAFMENAGAHPRFGGGNFGDRARGIQFHGLATAADVIGIEPADLAATLRSGQTVAEVATENGVDPQAVIDALVAELNGRVDQAVADGRITEDRAAQMKANAVEKFTAFVNEGHQHDGPMGRGGRMR